MTTILHNNNMSEQKTIETPPASTPKEVEPTSLFFSEQCKDLAREVTLSGPNALKAHDSEREAVHAIVEKVTDQVSLDIKMNVPSSKEEIRAERAKLTADVSAEVREAFGPVATKQELDARIETWRSENLNETMEAEHRAAEEAREKKEEPAKEKSIIDVIIDKILELLGLTEPKTPPTRQKSKDDKDKDSEKGKKEPFLKRLLKAVGLLE